MTRAFADCTAPQVAAGLTGESILCLPIGSTEQHGPHLPLGTDTIIAERLAAAIARHVSGRHQVWLLPALPFGLSLEHAWAPGTISLRVATLTAMIGQLASEYRRATQARRLVIVNGHGGNRAILEPMMHEITADHGLAVCTLHASSLPSVKPDSQVADIHAGIGETSLMLHLAPETVNLAAIPCQGSDGQERAAAVGLVVQGRGVTWPWTSGDPRIARDGIIGDPRGASAELGRAILDSALEAASPVLDQLATATPGRNQ
jgi:creatinine amidohydrolase